MTLREAAATLGVHPDTLRSQIRYGALRAEKRGRDWWVTPSEVRRYAERHRRRGMAPPSPRPRSSRP